MSFRLILEYFNLDSICGWTNFIVKDLIITALISYFILKIWSWIKFKRKVGLMAEKLVKENNDVRGDPGKHLADMFLGLYNAQNKAVPKVEIGVGRYFGKSRWSRMVMAEELDRLELTEIIKEMGKRFVKSRDDKLAREVYKKIKKMVKQRKI